MSQQSTLLDKAVDKAAGNRQNGRSARAYNLSSTTLSRTKGRFIMLAAVLLFMLSACVDVSRQSPVRRDARSPKTYAPNNSSRSSRRLSFNQDGTFQISIFEDLHFGESETPLQDPSRTWLDS
ncbi:hypothetical protein H633G_10504 [Metarhizium anisopliae BRIP 53284]|nr:hypothetical protein H633G_10504 [Metarhizium anisopliae BRIP 53284]